jgi:Putative restriction endonuclease
MSMATATDRLDDDEFFVDPDELKMPENPEHRRVINAIGVVARRALEPNARVYRDMNWYPPDGGNAVAPDLMVLPDSAPVERSYREEVGGPSPIVVVEVPSRSDAVPDFFKKHARYRALGVTCYSVLTDPGTCGVLRFAAGSTDAEDWTGQPITELGGLAIEVDNDCVVIVAPNGDRIYDDADVGRLADQRAADADQRAADADQRADAARREAAELTAKLRAAGIEP